MIIIITTLASVVSIKQKIFFNKKCVYADPIKKTGLDQYRL